MSQFYQTEPIWAAQGLEDIMLKKRPSIRKFWIELLDDLPESCLICISGRDGKSKVAHEMMSRVLTMNDGKDLAEVYLCEINQHFRAQTFKRNLTKHFSYPQDEFICKLYDKLTYQCFDSPQAYDVFMQEIDKGLRENNNISMVIVDCFAFFYYFAARVTEDDGDKELTKFSFFQAILEQFKILSKKYSVTFVYTRPTYLRFQNEDKFTDISIEVRHKTDQTRTMRIRNRFTGKFKRANFHIESSGIEILDVDEMLEEDDVDSTSVDNDESSEEYFENEI